MGSKPVNTSASKAGLLMGRKLGMTRLFQDGVSVPVTAIEVPPAVVTQVRTAEKDGYTAVQIGSGEIRPRNATIPLIGHDARAGADVKRWHREFRVADDRVDDYTLGEELTVAEFEKLAFVDVSGTSKGKGFQGGMKRHNFAGKEATHGVERKHRSPGSIGGHGSNAGKSGRPKKGKRMAGHMGAERITQRSIDVIRVDAEQNLLLVKGPVPGPNRGMVEIRPSVRLYKTKGVKQAEKAG